MIDHALGGLPTSINFDARDYAPNPQRLGGFCTNEQTTGAVDGCNRADCNHVACRLGCYNHEIPVALQP